MTIHIDSFLSIVAIGISLLALMVTAKDHWRKIGTYIRGTFIVGTSRDCNDHYITCLTLENLKDRAVTIFSIYLKVGHNYYIQLEDLEDKPLIIRPFETYQKELGPVEFYAVSANRIDLNKLFNDKRTKKQIVLSTSEGKYRVPSDIRRWNPITELFRNHMTAIIMPVYSVHKGVFLGSNIKFVIEFVSSKGEEEIVPIHARDYEVKVFRNFRLTPESLESKEALEALLREQVQNGALSCKEYAVYDMASWRERAHSFYTGKMIHAEYLNAFQYRIIGRIATRYSDWKLKRENKRREIQRVSENKIVSTVTDSV